MTRNDRDLHKKQSWCVPKAQASAQLRPGRVEAQHTHAGKDLSRFSRSSRVTRLARLKERSGLRLREARPS